MKYIVLPVSELTGALRTAIVARLKNYGNNPDALFNEDTQQTVLASMHKRRSNGQRYIILSFINKPAFIPARFRDNAIDFDKIRTRQELRDYLNSNVFDDEITNRV